MMKCKIKLIVPVLLILLITIVGITYAFYEYYRVGENHQLIVGNIYLKYNENTNSINLNNVFPLSAEKAREKTDNFITFTISGLNTTTNKDIWYEIMLNEGDEETGKIRAKAEDLVFDLSVLDDNGKETLLIDAESYDNINAKRIWVEIVHNNTNTEYSKTYKLRMWLSEDVVISDTLEGADYTTTDFANGYASAKVSVYGDFEEKDLSEYVSGYITYDANGNTEVSVPLKQALYANAVTTINATIEDELFAGWATSADGNVVYKTGDKITEKGDITLYAVWLSNDLGSNIVRSMSLTDADSGGTRFVYGSDVDNNYVWYSGKLWRIVSIDETGNIKLVTQGNMTSVAWSVPVTEEDGTTTYSLDYSTSQIRSWLNNDFLPTLYDTNNLLVDSTWDYTKYTSFPTITTGKLETTSSVIEKVGLLNIYEFMMTGGTRSSSTTNTFLNNGYYWWTMSPYDNSYIWGSAPPAGYAYYDILNYGFGARPSVNLKSGTKVLGGNGKKSNPYIIDGDKKTGTTSELLSNRISGEYINFNNTKYRIVGVETINGQQLTKVTMADYDENKKNILTTSISFGSTTTYSTSEGVGKYLSDWYNGTSINTIYKNMIATDGIEWYMGPDDGIGYDYTLSKTGTTINTPIGLGYYGEIFSSQFGEGSSNSNSAWLITKHSSSNSCVISLYNNTVMVSPTVTIGVRPSFYLKSDVKIVSGNGLPNSPYEIAL